MDECLTLFYSTFPGVSVHFADYRIVRDAPVVAEPAIVFREVDSHAALYLEILHYVPGIVSGVFEGLRYHQTGYV